MFTFPEKSSTFSGKRPILPANVRKIITSKVGFFYHISAIFCTKQRKWPLARQGARLYIYSI